MAQIAMRIPTGSTTWIQGECTLSGYETYLMVDKVSYGISIESEVSEDERRTVHTPKMSEIIITRRVDVSTSDLTRYVLSLNVANYPWEIYFLRDLGGDEQGSGDSSYYVRHVCYMVLSLYEALIVNQSVALEEGALTETLRINATAIDWQYTAYDDEQVPLGQVGFSFDVQAGTIS